MSEPDPTLASVTRGVELSRGGDPIAARAALAVLWADIGAERGDPLHRCAIAHAMADLQEDVVEELVWDLRALQAADAISDERAAAVGVPVSVAAFYPSLHLNLGDCYRRLGDPHRAEEHLRQGRAALGALADDGYAQHVRAGLDRLADRLRQSL